MRSGPPTGEEGAIISRAADAQVLDQPWGKLTWFTSAEIGNSATLKLGQAVIRQNQQNPLHHHPNCDKVFRVERGRILQTIANKTVEVMPGDVASIPQGLKHNARNIGTEDAILSVSYSSAFCRTIGE